MEEAAFLHQAQAKATYAQVEWDCEAKKERFQHSVALGTKVNEQVCQLMLA